LSGGRATGLLAAALVLLLAGLLFREALSGGEVLSAADYLLRMPPWAADTPRGFVAGNPVLSDQATQFQPWTLLAQRQLDASVLPLWNSLAACGQPLFANMQSALLSPYAIWWHLLPFGAALLAIAVSKLLLAGVGTALLARRLGCSPAAACLAGLAFALGGFEFLWLGHPHSATGALLPLLLLLVERWLERGGRGWLPVTWALGVAALVLSGHVETALHVALIVALWAVLRSAGRPWRARLATLAALLGWAVVGALVAGVQWVPFVEYLLHSSAYAQRTGLQEEWRQVPWALLPWVLAACALIGAACVLGRRAALAQQRGRWPRAALAALAVLAAGAAALSLLDVCGLSGHYRLLWWPDAWGHPVPARGLPWNGPRAFVNINGGYASLIVLPLAFIGLLCAPRRPALRALSWLWLLGFVLGYEVPLVSHLLNRLPLLDLSLNYRMTLLVGFAGALLAGFGLDALADAVSRRRPLGTALLLGAAVAGALALAPHVPWPAGWLPPRQWADSFPAPPDGEPYVHAPVQTRWLLLGACALLLPLIAALRRSTAPSQALRVAALVVICADLYVFARGFNPSAPPDEIYPPSRVTDWLAAQPGSSRIWCVDIGTLPPETAGVYGLRDVRGYDALGIERVALQRELLRPTQADERGLPAPEALDVAHPLFGLLDVGFVLAPNDWAPPAGATLEKAFEVPSCTVWRNTGWHAPAFVCGEARDVRPYLEHAVSASELAPAVARRHLARNLGAEVARIARGLHGPPPQLLLEADAPPAAGAPFAGEVQALERAEQQQRWEVRASAPGWLCVSDAIFPGWRADVDGVETPIEPAFFGMRAVRVPAGTSTVTFRYEPASVRWGVVMSAVGVLAVGMAAVRRRQAG
jgi:hypothetical protein